jgi:hypothetical protein
VTESRIRVPWILSGSNGARIDVISLQQLSVRGCSSSAKSAFHGVGHRHWGRAYMPSWRHILWWWIRKVNAGFVAGFRSVSLICMAALVAYEVVRHRVPSGFLEHYRLGFSAQSFLVRFFTIEIDETLWRKRSELS